MPPKIDPFVIDLRPAPFISEDDAQADSQRVAALLGLGWQANVYQNVTGGWTWTLHKSALVLRPLGPDNYKAEFSIHGDVKIEHGNDPADLVVHICAQAEHYARGIFNALSSIRA